MTVVVNGVPRTIADQSTLADVVTAFGLDAAAIVAEVSGEIVTPDAYAATVLSPGDRVELVRFVGGG